MLRSRGADKESLAAGYSLLLLAMILPGRGHGPPTWPGQSLSGQQTANAPAPGVCRAEPAPGSGAAGGEGDQAGSVSRWGVTMCPGKCGWGWLCCRHWVSLRGEKCLSGRMSWAGLCRWGPAPSVTQEWSGEVAWPGRGAQGQVLRAGWSLWALFGPTQQPLRNAALRAVSLSLPCPGAGCSMLLQFLTAICGQGSTRRDSKPVTSALHS